jgi:hypothetical protein
LIVHLGGNVDLSNAILDNTPDGGIVEFTAFEDMLNMKIKQPEQPEQMILVPDKRIIIN